MGIGVLKKLNTIMPDGIKTLFAPFIRKGLIDNRIFVDQYDKLILADSLPEERKEELRNNYIKETLIHAYEHTTYYKKLFDDIGFDAYSFTQPQQLAVIPVLTRKDVIKHFEELQADDITDFYENITGGSTGTPLKLNLSKESIYRERAFVYHFFHTYGYDYKKSKVASFRGTNFNKKNVRVNPLYNEIQLNPCNITDDTIYEYYDAISKFGATFLHGFPSAIYCFCKYAHMHNLKLNGMFSAVFCVSENLFDFQKQFIESTLVCPCTSFYGHTERNSFAEMDNNGLYHFNKLYGYHELSKDNEIISTGFINKKMPLIRYIVDDTAIPTENGYRITGHRDGFLYGKNGELLSGASLEVHSVLLDRIVSYQLLQKKKGELIVVFIPNEDFAYKDREALKELFQNKVGNALDVDVEEVDKMKLTKANKFKLIIQELPNQES